MPGTDLSGFHAFYFSASSTDDADANLRSLIKLDLEARGFEIVEVTDLATSNEGYARFDYKPDWHWDITPYLLELRVAVYNPEDSTLIAQAQSMQTSLARRSTEVVVERAIASLFDDQDKTNSEN